MNISTLNSENLRAISPDLLSAYARSEGWNRGEPYRNVSHLYTGESLPEVIIPHTDQIGDYASVVAKLIELFADAAGQDPWVFYQNLKNADRDVIRFRAVDAENDGTLPIEVGAELVNGACKLVLAAASSVGKSSATYRPKADGSARGFLNRVRLGQTMQGSYVISLFTPKIVPPKQRPLFPDYPDNADTPFERRTTRRLTEALSAARKAIDASDDGDTSAFLGAVGDGVSANLCNALNTLLTKTIEEINVSVNWARTLQADRKQYTASFASKDKPALVAAADVLNDRKPERKEKKLTGYVRKLDRKPDQSRGTVSLLTTVEDNKRPVSIELEEPDYLETIRAHESKQSVTIQGDLEKRKQRWHLLNARIVDTNKDQIHDRSSDS